MLCNLNDVLYDAKKNKYAVGLFNTVCLEMAEGVIAAAEETRSPVIIGTAEVLLPFSELEQLSYLILPLAKKASVPVVVHFDHGLTTKRIYQAMELGFSSIMYDCSTLSYEANIDELRRVVADAHSRGVSVEGELGHVGANDAEHGGETDSDSSIYTQPEQAVDFVRRTGVDALAVAIGTAHGAYKKKPKLDFIRLAEIAEAVSVPLVLHGGSGLSDDDFRRSVAGGIAKVNIFTDINNACAAASYNTYAQALGQGKTLGQTDVMRAMVAAVKAETEKKMTLFGSCGRG
ncbi:MAG: class II fructose-bisphosphate aldolase [Eubacteriales bacterium]